MTTEELAEIFPYAKDQLLRYEQFVDADGKTTLNKEAQMALRASLRELKSKSAKKRDEKKQAKSKIDQFFKVANPGQAKGLKPKRGGNRGRGRGQQRNRSRSPSLRGRKSSDVDMSHSSDY